LSVAEFENAAPLVRRTFASFANPERRRIGENVKKLSGQVPAVVAGKATSGTTSGAAGGRASGYDSERGAKVDAILRLILGKEFG
jgi:hypothetical protein